MEQQAYPRCGLCAVKACENPAMMDRLPPFCPMKLMPEDFIASKEEYACPGVDDFARQASIQEFECYEQTPDGLRTRIPRIEELIHFSRKCGFKRLGLAFCGGLAEEARLLTGILEKNGFEVASVKCKAGAIPKEDLGLDPGYKIHGPDAFEPMCNPIAQARILNKSGVDLAVMLGLCIGHDTLFIKYCEVPLTVLAVKDRVLAHNPLAALYTSGSYYRRLADGIGDAPEA